MSDRPVNDTEPLGEPQEIEQPASLGHNQPADKTNKNSNRTLWIILAVVALVLVACCVGTLIVSIASRIVVRDHSMETVGTEMRLGEGTNGLPVSERTEERTFDIAGSPAQIVIKNDIGDTTIETGSDDQIHVFASVRSWGRDATDWSNARISMEEVDGVVYVTGDIPEGLSMGRSLSIDIRVTVPAATDIEVRTDVGETRISGVAGSIFVTGGVGDIEVRDFVGDLEARSDVGRIEVRDWTMSGDSNLETSVGTIEVGLVRSQSLQLDARSNIGDIRCDFDVDGEKDNSTGAGDSLRGTIGDDPQDELVLRTATGSIQITRD